MNKDDFNKIVSKIQAGDDRFAKGRIIEEELGYGKNRYVTCLQLERVLRLLSGDVDRLAAVKVVAPYLIDPQNAGKATRAIAQARIRKDAQQTIAELND